MTNAEWSRGDVLALLGLVIASPAMIAAWLAVPGFREWLNNKFRSEPIRIGDLSNAVSYDPPLPQGVIRADQQTLQKLLDAFSVVDMDWLQNKDFGGAFRWSPIEAMQHYVWQNDRPEDEFIDRELERLRTDLKTKVLQFSLVAGRNTKAADPLAADEVRSIPDRYEDRNYSDKRFFDLRDEINAAAVDVHSSYGKLVKRARSKMAMHSIS